MKDKLWKIISNPPMIKIQGVSVQAWQVPSIEDREAMVEAIVEEIAKREGSNERIWQMQRL